MTRSILESTLDAIGGFIIATAQAAGIITGAWIAASLLGWPL